MFVNGADEENVSEIFKFNLIQLKNFFGNLIRIKNIEKCKFSIREFIVKIQNRESINKNGNLKETNEYSIDSNSRPDNNLVDNIFKSVEPVHFRYILPNYLSTKKKTLI